MAPFIKGRWGHGGFREREGEQGGERESERERERERQRKRENQLLHIGFSLFSFSTVFATTRVDLSRKEA